MPPSAATRRFRWRLFGSAFMLALAYGWLGSFVSSRAPLAVDLLGANWFGVWTNGAWILTQSGFFLPLAIANVVVLTIGFTLRAWLPRALFATAACLATWIISNAFKDIFQRARPEHWLKLHETSYSYSSGHAADAVVVYALWALFIWRSNLPTFVRGVLSPMLVLWALGVSWSRIALGVHFPSDVLGGWFLGATVLCLGFAAFPRVPRQPVARTQSA